MLTIKHDPTSERTELSKRTYAPGYTLHDTCPNCGWEWTKDLASEYLVAYPVSGAPFDVNAYCDSCEHEWVAGQACYRLTVEIVDADPATTAEADRVRAVFDSRTDRELSLAPAKCPCCSRDAFFRYMTPAEAVAQSPLCWGDDETSCPGYETYRRRRDREDAQV